jgi:hypothetical protein
MEYLRQFNHWDRGFESHSKHRCLSAFVLCLLSCVSSGLASGCSPVQGVPTDCLQDSELILNGNWPESLIGQGCRRRRNILTRVFGSQSLRIGHIRPQIKQSKGHSSKRAATYNVELRELSLFHGTISRSTSLMYSVKDS